MDIRPIKDAECDAAAAIVADNPLWTEKYHYPRDKAAADLRESLAKGELILGAYDEALVGFAWILRRGAFGRFPYLRLLAVSPRAQGSGAGARLLAEAESQLKPERQFFLLCSDFNTGAQRFYQRSGFGYIGTISDFARDGIGEQLWVKRIG